jgi:hypothetical protein
MTRSVVIKEESASNLHSALFSYIVNYSLRFYWRYLVFLDSDYDNDWIVLRNIAVVSDRK